MGKQASILFPTMKVKLFHVRTCTCNMYNCTTDMHYTVKSAVQACSTPLRLQTHLFLHSLCI